jgi:hypothetical protein
MQHIWSIIVVSVVGSYIGYLASQSYLCGSSQVEEEQEEHIDVQG